MTDRVLVFASGRLPAACPRGHRWDRPRTYMLGWRTCTECPESLAGNRGHHVARCCTPGCGAAWLDPPHDGSAEAPHA